MVLISRRHPVAWFDDEKDGVVADRQGIAAPLIGHHHIDAVGDLYPFDARFTGIANTVPVPVVENHPRVFDRFGSRRQGRLSYRWLGAGHQNRRKKDEYKFSHKKILLDRNSSLIPAFPRFIDMTKSVYLTEVSQYC
jgi:glyoxylase-like metal-dependent hydrolase (beta-lactamase superfamily II)